MIRVFMKNRHVKSQIIHSIKHFSYLSICCKPAEPTLQIKKKRKEKRSLIQIKKKKKRKAEE
ncbi:hypothetical protein YC2023_117173 [Brassica napus]